MSFIFSSCLLFYCCFFLLGFCWFFIFFFFFQAEDGIRDGHVTGVQTCALPISQSLHQRAASPAEHVCVRLQVLWLRHRPPLPAAKHFLPRRLRRYETNHKAYRQPTALAELPFALLSGGSGSRPGSRALCCHIPTSHSPGCRRQG